MRSRKLWNSNEPAPAGARFGKLTVIEFSHRDRKSIAYWRCKCDCGGEITTRASLIRYGRTTSCGCKRKEINAGRLSGLEERNHAIFMAAKEGKSYRDIADEFHVTKNVVAGAVFRVRKKLTNE